MRGQGGTVASTAFNKVASIIDERYSPARYNIYVFYSSDGDNFREDRDAAEPEPPPAQQRDRNEGESATNHEIPVIVTVIVTVIVRYERPMAD